jgi:hypothetical protein
MRGWRLYLREECHLCEALLAELQLRGRLAAVELIDIDRDAELALDYGLRIPVLRRMQDGREWDWPFALDAIDGW